ncbi:MAG: FeoB-associated Cys-rich membrane protein [Muribaculaceae bacterium]|nr:FeoB-associated Cys-rich membrane protein [Muribaculaceae bacterium]
MIQWIIVAIILALCVLYVCNRIRRRRKGGACCDCCQLDCPSRKQSRGSNRCQK